MMRTEDPYYPSFEQRRLALLRQLAIEQVIDVGANRGQYAQDLRSHSYTGNIVSFEPMRQAHAALVATAQSDPKWEIAPPVALGRQEGTAELNVANNSISSSLLPMRETHLQASPESHYIGQETVKVRTLDSFLTDGTIAETSTFLKIDTQGYEEQVLSGATSMLTFVRGLELELSLVTLYDQQMLAWELVRRLREAGWDCFGIRPGFSDPVTKRMLQMDALFVRESLDV
ncbi:MAG: FkbM family methyltransferase [Nannocystaceae bacterium]